jgi:hypothetical protein
MHGDAGDRKHLEGVRAESVADSCRHLVNGGKLGCLDAGLTGCDRG